MPLKSSSSYAGRSRRDSARSLFLRVFSGAVLFAGLGLGGARADDATAKADVEAFLAAGEFQAAAKRAAEENGPVRDQLMAHIASFQAAQQKPAIAQRALRMIADERQRVAAGEQVARQEMANGGADFSQLMMLIQNETSGPWFDVDGEGGTMTPFTSGIKVDPNGILTRDAREDQTGRLSQIERQARTAALNKDMAMVSQLRLVSLTRLEKEVARRLESGKPATESMKQLAGLSQIQFVIAYPEEGEIVIGGPAAGWSYNEHGMPVSLESGRPTLQLDDLVTVLRTFDENGRGVFGCSIDPQQENLKKVVEYVSQSQAKGPLSPAGVRSWANKVGQILGPQDITVFGVPANSRVARVMVEADYRMKLIGIGKLQASENIPDYFELLAKNPALASGSLDALRWWMTMQYESVLHSPDRTAFEVRGSGVKCLSENQYLASNGERVPTGKAEPVNQQFASNFTKYYQELAARDPVFADLQGIFDLALVAAVIDHNRLDERTGWDRGVFAEDGAYRTAAYATPQKTDSVVNHHVYNGKDVVLQVAGGVTADLGSVVRNPEMVKESPRVSSVATSAKAPELPVGRWWWDAR